MGCCIVCIRFVCTPHYGKSEAFVFLAEIFDKVVKRRHAGGIGLQVDDECPIGESRDRGNTEDEQKHSHGKSDKAFANGDAGLFPVVF